MTTQTETETRPDLFVGLHPIFRDCADYKTCRYSLEAPWREGEFIHATDGRWCVRVPVSALGPGVDLAALEPGERRVPKNVTTDIFDCPTWRYRDTPAVLPEVGPPNRACPECKGEKVVPEKECDNCYGGGQCRCDDCDCRHDCGRCGGKGKFPPGPCEACNGSGRGRPERESVELEGGVLLDRHFVAILREYFAAVYLPLDLADKGVPVRFAIGLVEGRVMQITRHGG